MSATQEKQEKQEKQSYSFRVTQSYTGAQQKTAQSYPIFDTKSELIEFIDELLYSVSGQRFSLMNELNNMQTEALFPGEDQGKSVFDNKFTIPFYFINLILIHYGLELYEVR